MSKSKQLRSRTPALLINRLAIVLKEERITNRALAAALGYEETTVSKWTRNSIQPPIHTFLRIALIINRDMKDLFISINDIDEAEKKKYLKLLADVAEKSKRVGRYKK